MPQRLVNPITQLRLLRHLEFPFTLEPMHVVQGAVGGSAWGIDRTLPIQQGEHVAVVVFAVCNGEILSVGTFPAVKDQFPPEIVSFEVTEDGNAELVASKQHSTLHKAILFLTLDGTIWSNRVMNWESGDFLSATRFSISIQDILDSCKGGQVQGAVRDQHGNWVFSEVIPL